MTDYSTWYSISDAADFLGVHFSTLRRWADKGLIEYVRTPGGKRKFQQATLLAFLNQYRAPVKEANTMLVFQNNAILKTREKLQSLDVAHKGWYGLLTEDVRQKMRSTGNRLVALMFHYSSHTENQELFLEEARRITRDYGRICCAAGIEVTDCVQTFLMFRLPILIAIHETGALPGMTDQEGSRLFQQLNYFLDETLVAMIDEYQLYQAENNRNHR
jgi:excisionase family DNA binding protein